jgi:putative selenate reductase
MSDLMRIQPFAVQLRRILLELTANGSIFDIHRSLFHVPLSNAPYAVPSLFGRFLATPVGPSAGPHTQLSQNIVSAFLCGGRFIELKTVQRNDALEIPRPCIDMTDEGYNVEWSQELKLEESAHEYVVAWALVHLVPRILGWDAELPAASLPGVIFDMSVGYDLEGIRHPRMTRFMDTLADASEPLAAIHDTLAREFPGLADVPIPTRIANSVTLSTMHGCPPDEIERLARYLLEERGLHTVVKLNPTLLGRTTVLEILRDRLGFTEIDIPPAVFEHDLQYDKALAVISSLRAVAARLNLTFGVKLSNTLAMHNHSRRLPGDEMYMSGRALYPVTMSLYERLARDVGGRLHVSYSAGADACNAASILSCGALPVTGCTDLLKPGGFARMTQWLTGIESAMAAAGATSLEEWSADRDTNLLAAVTDALGHPRYRKQAFPHGLPKVSSGLGLWDCVVAPCVEACAVEQDVPEYAWWIAQGEHDRALEAILAKNPLPGVTGYVCTHLCQTRCTRNDYEETVAIRALKRIAEERGSATYSRQRAAGRRQPEGAAGQEATNSQRGGRLTLPAASRELPADTRHVAIVGSGPSGLAAAAFLAVNGVQATIFEARDVAGGMMRLVPPFRLPADIIERDIARIISLGVELRLNSRISGPPEELLARGFDAVYLASGFQRDAPLRVPGVEGPGVVAALHLLDRSRRGDLVDLGRTSVVIGGGDTAMDAVRTSQRLTGHPVTILYRRTRHEMPAAEEEVDGALEEGNRLEELVSPVEILRTRGMVIGVRCLRNALGAPGADGRRSPVPIPGSDFVVACDSVVVAVGQLPDLSFLDGSRVTRHERGGVVVDGTTRSAGPAGVFAGGDMVVEPGSIISACADGRKAAEAICAHLGVSFAEPAWKRPALSRDEVVEIKAVRARRVARQTPAMLHPAQRRGFALIESTFTEEQARDEARRCVQCTSFCDKCVEVCPNRANYTFIVRPFSCRLPVVAWQDNALAVVATEEFRITQDRQILHVDDFCNECDNCQTFCVHHGRPYRDKPRLFLDTALYEAEHDNAFRLAGAEVRRRDGGRESRLLVGADGHLDFDDECVAVRLDSEWRPIQLTARKQFDGTRSLRFAAEMWVLHQGVTSSLPFLGL